MLLASSTFALASASHARRLLNGNGKDKEVVADAIKEKTSQADVYGVKNPREAFLEIDSLYQRYGGVPGKGVKDTAQKLNEERKVAKGHP
jgi:hypothetical protein